MGVRSVAVVLADLVQRAELDAAQGRGPEVAHDPRTSSLPEFTNPNGAALFSTAAPKSCSPTRNLAAAYEHVRTLADQGQPESGLSNALTNSRQIQHWTEDLVRPHGRALQP
jgi:hypothetical protein